MFDSQQLAVRTNGIIGWKTSIKTVTKDFLFFVNCVWWANLCTKKKLLSQNTKNQQVLFFTNTSKTGKLLNNKEITYWPNIDQFVSGRRILEAWSDFWRIIHWLIHRICGKKICDGIVEFPSILNGLRKLVGECVSSVR